MERNLQSAEVDPGVVFSQLWDRLVPGDKVGASYNISEERAQYFTDHIVSIEAGPTYEANPRRRIRLQTITAEWDGGHDTHKTTSMEEVIETPDGIKPFVYDHHRTEGTGLNGSHSVEVPIAEEDQPAMVADILARLEASYSEYEARQQ